MCCYAEYIGMCILLILGHEQLLLHFVANLCGTLVVYFSLHHSPPYAAIVSILCSYSDMRQWVELVRSGAWLKLYIMKECYWFYIYMSVHTYIILVQAASTRDFKETKLSFFIIHQSLNVLIVISSGYRGSFIPFLSLQS